MSIFREEAYLAFQRMLKEKEERDKRKNEKLKSRRSTSRSRSRSATRSRRSFSGARSRYFEDFFRTLSRNVVDTILLFNFSGLELVPEHLLDDRVRDQRKDLAQDLVHS